MTPKQPSRVVNTWMDDSGKLILLETIIKTIKEQKLLQNGTRTFLAINAADGKLRDDILKRLKAKGIQSGGCGNQTLRLRPALIFQEHHGNIFLDTFRMF
ncbi:hypothetical protein MTP99_017244 [Tenebrio molitor]|nr:hypothetical protein MTP99_017244 [Tenebrio molitor]